MLRRRIMLQAQHIGSVGQIPAAFAQKSSAFGPRHMLDGSNKCSS
jgi:hypothetical protein